MHPKCIINKDDACQHDLPVFFLAEKLFKTEWPKSTRLLLGERSVTTAQGARHKNLRGLVTGPLSLDNLKRYVPFVEERVLAQLGTWKDGATVTAYGELKKVSTSERKKGCLLKQSRCLPNPLEEYSVYRASTSIVIDVSFTMLQL